MKKSIQDLNKKFSNFDKNFTKEVRVSGGKKEPEILEIKVQ
jgi:hypothetical protein